MQAQVEGFAVQPHFKTRRVNEQVSQVDGGAVAGSGAFAGRAALAAPQDGPDPRHQLARVEGLGHVIVSADLQANDLVQVIVAGGQHQDGRVSLLGLQAAANLQPIQARQHDIQNHQAGLQAAGGCQGSQPIADRFDAETFPLQVKAGQLDDIWLIVHQQDQLAGHRPGVGRLSRRTAGRGWRWLRFLRRPPWAAQPPGRWSAPAVSG